MRNTMEYSIWTPISVLLLYNVIYIKQYNTIVYYLFSIMKSVLLQDDALDYNMIIMYTIIIASIIYINALILIGMGNYWNGMNLKLSIINVFTKKHKERSFIPIVIIITFITFLMNNNNNNSISTLYTKYECDKLTEYKEEAVQNYHKCTLLLLHNNSTTEEEEEVDYYECSTSVEKRPELCFKFVLRVTLCVSTIESYDHNGIYEYRLLEQFYSMLLSDINNNDKNATIDCLQCCGCIHPHIYLTHNETMREVLQPILCPI